MIESTTVQDPPSDFGIRLMDDEQVLVSLRPFRFVRYAVVSAIPLVVVMLIPVVLIWPRCVRRPDLFAVLCVVDVMLIPIYLLWAIIAVRRYHYWLTTKRVIWCHGFVGYKVRSVPLERISDVAISRTLTEMLAGISSIEIRDMTGQSQAARGSGARWIGVKEAPEIQKQILQQVREVNEAGKKL